MVLTRTSRLADPRLSRLIVGFPAADLQQGGGVCRAGSRAVVVGLTLCVLVLFSLASNLAAQGLPQPGTIARPAAEAQSQDTGLGMSRAAAIQQYGQIAAIRIEGNRRVDQSAILSYLGLQVGDPFSPDVLNEALKSLIATSLFIDANFQRQGSTLVVRVEEQRILNIIAFEGNKKIKDEELEAEIQARPRQPFTKSKIQEDVRRILSLYQAQGRFATEVEPKLILLDQNRANLVFEIVESDPTKILGVNFVGNRFYSDNRLRRVILSREKRIWRFANAMVNYDPTRVAVDAELLREFYRNNGFADVKITDSVGELTPDRGGFYLTYTVEEGRRYRITEIAYDNKHPRLDTDVVARENDVRRNSFFDAARIRSSIEAMTEAANERGAPFVKIDADFDKNEEAGTIKLTYLIEKGPETYVERINIVGNEKTRDYVIRRKFEFDEGDAFNLAKLKRTQRNLQRLGYFSKVEVKPREGSAEDRVILDTTVEETSTNQLELGGSYSSATGFGANFGISNRNFLGRGQTASIQASLAQNNRSINVGITEPYFLGYNVSAGISGGFSDRTVEASGYSQQTYNGGVSFGYELFKDVRQSWRYNFEYANIDPADGTTAIITGEDPTTIRSSLTHNISWDTRDSLTDPTEGWLMSLSTEAAVLGGDVRFLKNSGKAAWYYGINDNFTLAFEGQGGVNIPLNDEGSFVADRYQMGALQVRGFSPAGIGPIAGDTGQRVGATKYYAGSAELRFPLPIPADIEIDGRLFVDVGALWDVNTTFGEASGVNSLNDTSDPRISLGYGFTWASPIGPLQLDFGYAIAKQELDEKQVFRFNIQRGF